MNFEHEYPSFGQEHITMYQILATTEEKEECARQFRVSHIHNKKPDDVVLSVSFFAKCPDPGLSPIEIPGDLTRLHPSIRRGEVTWDEAFISRFEAGVKQLRERGVDWSIRAYVAADMEDYLHDRLMDLDVEMRVMETSSIYHNPGACWRFLAADDAEFFFTRDAEDINPTYVEEPCIRRFIDATKKHQDPRMFRMIWNWDYDDVSTVYRPVSGNGVGGRIMGAVNVRAALEAYHWCGMREQNDRTPPRSAFLPRWHMHPVRGPRELFGAAWPKYGGDEQFAGQFLYWAACRGGWLDTVVGCNNPGVHVMMASDLVEVLKHNPRAFVSWADDPHWNLNPNTP